MNTPECGCELIALACPLADGKMARKRAWDLDVGRGYQVLPDYPPTAWIAFFFHIVARCRHWRQPRANREAKGLAALPRPPGRGAGDSRRASLYGRRWRRE